MAGRYEIGSQGSTTLIMICTALIIIILAAISTDIGYGAAARYSLQKNALAVAKDGAQILVKSNRNEAIEYMKKSSVLKVNDLNLLEVDVLQDSRKITITMGKPFKYIFLKYIGFRKTQIKETISVRLLNISKVKGARPFGIREDKIKLSKNIILSDKSEKSKDLVEISILDFNKGDIETNILYGNREYVEVGEKLMQMSNIDYVNIKRSLDCVMNRCKHKPKCTYSEYEKSCESIIILPVFKNQAKNNEISITGFAGFLVEGCEIKNNGLYIKGSFLEDKFEGVASENAQDFGMYGLRIMK